MSKKDDPLSHLSANEKAQILKSQQNLKIAIEIDDEVVKTKVEVDELSVAYSSGTASLFGYVKSQKDKEKIDEIAQKHPEVKEVLNGIVIE